jgi:replicative DNA helicase
MTPAERPARDSLTHIVNQVDTMPAGSTPPDTVPTGFPSLDGMLGGGLRQRDLIVLGGDVGAGKSALALAIALRTAARGYPVAFFSGEMDEDRLMERAVALDARVTVDDLRTARLSDARRSAVGAAALRFRSLDLEVHPLLGATFEEALAPLRASAPALVVIDYLQLVPPATPRPLQEEEAAATVRAVKALALDLRVACLLVAQLPRHVASRPDPRPTLDDFGALGSVKQHADVVLGIYREEMYNPGGGIEGAAEVILAKNRNGPTGFVDLYFYRQWLRFEDMLDPDR